MNDVQKRVLAVAMLCMAATVVALILPGPRRVGSSVHELRAWTKPAINTPGSPTNEHAFRPILAHAAHPQSRKILLHNQPDSVQPFFDVHATDLDPSTALLMSTSSAPLTLQSTTKILLRPKNKITSLNLTRSARMAFNRGIEWEDVEVEVPDVTDRETLRTLAKMASNAYVTPESSEWWGLDEWNSSIPFGWEKDADGLRGHVFANDDNSTVVISIKGTSAGLLGGGGNTAKNDKFNDNLLFSCCCARVDFTWSTVCDCYAGGYKCEKTCLENAVIGDSVYTTVGTNLYNNISNIFPDANIWIVGHSLGGSLASLIGLSFGVPVVTFEAPGDRMAASRLHLPMPPGMPMEKMGITHVYNTADPIPNGQCVGPYSGCYAAGFAMEARCHVGQSIIYDTIGRKGWASDLRAHRIGEIINRVLDEDWDPAPEDQPVEPPEKPSSSALFERVLRITLGEQLWGWPGRGLPAKRKEPEPENEGKRKKKNPNAVPKAEAETECVDCFRWEYGDGMKKEPPTTTIATTSVHTAAVTNLAV